MTHVVRIGEARRGALPLVRFNRSELKKLLSLYSRRVADGEWRDYAIDHQPGRAVFAVFRHTFDRPLYTITKRDGRSPSFEVATGQKRVSLAATLEDALAFFDRQLRLVH